MYGAKTSSAWLARTCRLPKAAARRIVKRGRHLRHLPVAEKAFRSGEINAAHVDAVVAVRRPDTEEKLARDEEVLVKQAKRLPFEHFVKAVAYWDQLADPDGTEEAAEERRNRRDVYLEASISGMYLGSMTLDPISGSIVSGELGRIEDEFFKADWARAREERGGNPSVEDLWRTPAQRRADALVEMAARSALVQPDGARRPPAPLFSVLVDWPTLSGRVCELAEGIVLSPGELVPWLSIADLERAVMEPTGRVEVSPTQRLFTGGTRRAIELRDRRMRARLLRHAGVAVSGRPPAAVGPGRPDDPGKRTAVVRVPQPVAEPRPATARVGGVSERGGWRLSNRGVKLRQARRFGAPAFCTADDPVDAIGGALGGDGTLTAWG